MGETDGSTGEGEGSADTSPSIREDGAHINRLIRWTAGGGVACLLIGLLVETRLPGAIAWLRALAGMTPLPSGEAGGHGMDPTGVLTLLFKELGVAFLVASIVALVVEKAAKAGDSRRVSRFIEAVSGHVIMGVYRLRHDEAFVKAAVETNLEAPIVRRGMSLRYKVRALTVGEATTVWPTRCGEALQRFVMLEMVSHYVFRNVSTEVREVDIRYVAPLRQGGGARAVTRATYVRIDGVVLDEAAIRQGLATARQRAVDSGGTIEAKPSEKAYLWPRKLAPSLGEGDGLDVMIGVQVLKERSDNEVWGSFYPTLGDITLSLEVLAQMHFGVRELSSASLVAVPTNPDATSRTWYLQGPVLRHNSIVFWWRILEDDAEEDAESLPLEPSLPALPAVIETKRGLARLLDLIGLGS